MQGLNEALADTLEQADLTPKAEPATKDHLGTPATPRFRPADAANSDDQLAALLRAGDHILRARREKLEQMEQTYHQLMLDIPRLRAEIALLCSRMGYGP